MIKSIRLSFYTVCLGLWNVHCAPLQHYRAMLCTIDLCCAPLHCVVHHGACSLFRFVYKEWMFKCRRVIRRKPSNMPQILTNVHCKHYRLFKVNQSKLSVVQCWSHIIVLINVVRSWLIHMPSMQQKNVDQLMHLDQPIIGSRLINFDQHLQCVINIDQSLTNFDQLWLTLINPKCLQCTNLVRIWGIFDRFHQITWQNWNVCSFYLYLKFKPS